MNDSALVPKSPEWLAAMVKAISQFAQTTLCMQECNVVSADVDLPWEKIVGAYVPWTYDHCSVHLGLISSHEGCRQLTQRLLALGGAPVDELDMLDAMREIVNMLAGMTKGVLGGRVTVKHMGLPVVIDGVVKLRQGQELLAELVKIDEIYCYVIVLYHG